MNAHCWPAMSPSCVICMRGTHNEVSVHEFVVHRLVFEELALLWNVSAAQCVLPGICRADNPSFASLGAWDDEKKLRSGNNIEDRNQFHQPNRGNHTATLTLHCKDDTSSRVVLDGSVPDHVHLVLAGDEPLDIACLSLQPCPRQGCHGEYRAIGMCLVGFWRILYSSHKLHLPSDT